MNSSRLIRFLSLNLEKTTGRRKHRVMSSHVRDVITLFLFILVILFLWSLMSISSLTWLCEEPSWTTTPYFSTLALSPWSIWGYGWRCQHLWTWARQIQRLDSDFHGWRCRKDCSFFFCFFSHVFEIAQQDFTRKDVTVNGVIRTCPELTGYLLIFLWLRHVIFIAILMSSNILVNVPSRGFTASSCPILRVSCRHVLRKGG